MFAKRWPADVPRAVPREARLCEHGRIGRPQIPKESEARLLERGETSGRDPPYIRAQTFCAKATG